MLVLTRKIGEKVLIGNNITVSVVDIKGNRVQLAFEAPNQVRILRSELAWDDEMKGDDQAEDLPMPCLQLDSRLKR
jgi:carbon storage regulator